MKLSRKTLALLENFSTICDSILIEKGNKIRSMSVSKSVLGIATTDVEFEEELAIFSLPKFLKLYRCIQNPTLTVQGDHSVLIHNDVDTLEYRLSDKNMINTPPKKELNLPSVEVEVEIEQAQFAKCLKISKMLEHSSLAIVGDGETIWLKVMDAKNTGSDSFKTRIGETENYFTFIINPDNL